MAEAGRGPEDRRSDESANAPSGDRGQVESVGTVLFLGVVVVALATFGAFYLAEASHVTGGAGGDTAILVDASPERLSVTHNGGQSIPLDAVTVLVEDDTGEVSHAMTASAVRGDGDDDFEAGETWRLDWNRSAGETVTVVVVNERDGVVVFREAVTASAGEPTNAAQGD